MRCATPPCAATSGPRLRPRTAFPIPDQASDDSSLESGSTVAFPCLGASQSLHHLDVTIGLAVVFRHALRSRGVVLAAGRSTAAFDLHTDRKMLGEHHDDE